MGYVKEKIIINTIRRAEKRNELKRLIAIAEEDETIASIYPVLDYVYEINFNMNKVLCNEFIKKVQKLVVETEDVDAIITFITKVKAADINEIIEDMGKAWLNEELAVLADEDFIDSEMYEKIRDILSRNDSNDYLLDEDWLDDEDYDDLDMDEDTREALRLIAEED